jgi:hypothetical protein
VFAGAGAGTVVGVVVGVAGGADASWTGLVCGVSSPGETGKGAKAGAVDGTVAGFGDSIG